MQRLGYISATVIASGHERDVLLRLAAGESIGTALVASTPKLAARKQWMANHLQLRGAVLIDDGAVAKLRDGGKSLLPIGMLEVKGEFARQRRIAHPLRPRETARRSERVLRDPLALFDRDDRDRAFAVDLAIEVHAHHVGLRDPRKSEDPVRAPRCGGDEHHLHADPEGGERDARARSEVEHCERNRA